MSYSESKGQVVPTQDEAPPFVREHLASHDFGAEPRSDGLRWWISPDGMNKLAETQNFQGRVHVARDKAKSDALKNLGRYKFSNFGYHAARWVTLNALIGDKQPNPFSDFVQLARKMLGEKKL